MHDSYTPFQPNLIIIQLHSIYLPESSPTVVNPTAPTPAPAPSLCYTTPVRYTVCEGGGKNSSHCAQRFRPGSNSDEYACATGARFT